MPEPLIREPPFAILVVSETVEGRAYPPLNSHHTGSDEEELAIIVMGFLNRVASGPFILQGFFETILVHASIKILFPRKSKNLMRPRFGWLGWSFMGHIAQVLLTVPYPISDIQVWDTGVRGL